MRVVYLLVLLIIGGLSPAVAQKKVKLKQADQLRGIMESTELLYEREV